MSNFKKPSKATRNDPEPEVKKLDLPIGTGKFTIDLGNPDIIRGYQRSALACPLAHAANRVPGISTG